MAAKRIRSGTTPNAADATEPHEVRLLTTDTRIDPAQRVPSPHSTLNEFDYDEPRAESDDRPQASGSGTTVEVDLEAVEQLRNQARQLAVHLRIKQDELDRRDAEWQAQIAAHDNERRAAQVWYQQRCADLEEREAAFPAREREWAERREQLIAAEAAAVQMRQNEEAVLARHAEALAGQSLEIARREEELQQTAIRIAVETAAQRNAAAEVEARRAELQSEMQRLRRENDDLQQRREQAELELQRRRDEWERKAAEPSEFQVGYQRELNQRNEALDAREAAVVEQEGYLKQAMLEWERWRAELEEERERLAAQQRHDRLELAELRRRAETDAAERREAIERQSEQLDFRRAAIRREQEELAAAQRETLEMRLAAEELWTRLSGSLPPAALTEQMARIRTRLGEQYRIVQTDLAAQKVELDALRADLAAEGERLRFQTQELHRWAEARHEEIERQAAFLTGREAELERQDGSLYQRAQAWRQERFQLEQEIRRLHTELRRAGIELPPQPQTTERRRKATAA